MPRAIKAIDSQNRTRVIFKCPGCEDNHQIIVGVWGWNNSLDLPTFEGSVLVGGVQWAKNQSFHRPTHNVEAGQRIVCHSFVIDGKIQFLSDSTHNLSGQIVDLPDW